MESLTENRLSHIALSAIVQVHERCFTLELSEFKHIKIQNGTVAHLKPPMVHQWAPKLEG